MTPPNKKGGYSPTKKNNKTTTKLVIIKQKKSPKPHRFLPVARYHHERTAPFRFRSVYPIRNPKGTTGGG